MFSLSIIELFKVLQSTKEFVISKQVLKSGTRIGATVNEAIAAGSRADFVHKMAIPSKEARVTLYWLELLEKSQFIVFNYKQLIDDCTELVSILTSIVKTPKNSKLKTQN